MIDGFNKVLQFLESAFLFLKTLISNLIHGIFLVTSASSTLTTFIGYLPLCIGGLASALLVIWVVKFVLGR